VRAPRESHSGVCQGFGMLLHLREGNLLGRGGGRGRRRQGVPELTSVIVRGHDSSTVDGNSGELRFGAVSQRPKCREVYFGEGEERGQEERGWSRFLSHPAQKMGNFGCILLPASSKHGTVVRPQGH
jgi:hypothetical protein